MTNLSDPGAFNDPDFLKEYVTTISNATIKYVLSLDETPAVIRQALRNELERRKAKK